MDKLLDEIPSQAKYAAGGAAVALVLAMFTPAAVLLALEGAAATGIYLYRKNRKTDSAAGQVIDVTSAQDGEEK